MDKLLYSSRKFSAAVCNYGVTFSLSIRLLYEIKKQGGKNMSHSEQQAVGKNNISKVLVAMLLGILTAFFCLYVADGLYGIQGLKQTEYIGEIVGLPAYKKVVDVDNQTGGIIFWIFAIGLPILFSRWISWRDTLVNYWCYPIYWWVVDDMIGSHPGHAFLDPESYYSNSFPAFTLFPFVWTLFVFLIHSAVFICFQKFWKGSSD